MEIMVFDLVNYILFEQSYNLYVYEFYIHLPFYIDFKKVMDCSSFKVIVERGMEWNPEASEHIHVLPFLLQI